MPSLTVRAMAELLRLPAYEQVRILTEQKNPKQAPQIFRTPYYQPALTGIRRYFRSSNAKSALAEARGKIQGASNKARRQNNLRVLANFESSGLATRSLYVVPTCRVVANVGDVELRFSPDLCAREETDRDLFFYFNCRATKLDAEAAKLTLEIAHWVLAQNHIEAHPSDLEYADFAANASVSVSKVRPRTLQLLKANAKVISTLWASL